MPALPKLPSQFNSFVPPVIPRNRGLLILLPVVVIFLVISLFLLSENSTNYSKREPLEIALSDLKDQGSVFQLGPNNRARYLKNFEIMQSDASKEEKFKALHDNFDILNGYYIATHEIYARTLLERLADYLKVNYPKEYELNMSDFQVFCFDSDCPQKEFTSKLADLTDAVNNATFKNTAVKNSVLLKIEESKREELGDKRYNKYATIFSLILVEWRETKDPVIEALANKTKDVIKEEFPEQFEAFSANGDYDLK